MADQQDTVSVVLDAEQLIDAREYPTALWRLRIAAGNVQADDADAAWLFERIRDAAASVAWADPYYETDAQAVWDIVVKREAEIGDTPQDPPPRMPRRPPGGTRSAPASEGESLLRAADAVSDLAIVASVLSFLLAIVLGVELSRYPNEYGGTSHHGTVIVVWLVVGLLAALAWVGMAVGLRVLAFIVRSQRTAPTSL